MKVTIEENRVITLTYELRDSNADGELLERMDARYPFVFLFGNGKLLQSFEENLRGLGSDDSFEFILTANQAYGRSNALNVLKIPQEDFKRASDIPANYIQVGSMVNLTDDEGLSHNGKVIGIEAAQIEVDFNHAMVDKDLHFKGAVLAIREARLEELIKKHYIEEDGVRR
ncbi:MAG: FKBP-type peptidyl-prolyl cis-trans isomerase SlyD [Gammaproteobacteria bacterium]|jgi:FKBP-type peptidyl-prolyl cis-trans isomerase SlyD